MTGSPNLPGAGRVKAVSLRWRKRTEYTRWRPWVGRGANHTEYHFRTLHLTVERFPKVYRSDESAL